MTQVPGVLRLKVISRGLLIIIFRGKGPTKISKANDLPIYAVVAPLLELSSSIWGPLLPLFGFSLPLYNFFMMQAYGVFLKKQQERKGNKSLSGFVGK